MDYLYIPIYTYPTWDNQNYSIWIYSNNNRFIIFFPYNMAILSPEVQPESCIWAYTHSVSELPRGK